MTETNGNRELRVSADSHLSELPDLWEKGLPAKYRDRAPTFPRIQLGRGNHLRPGGYDPVARLKDMAADGISAEVLYPTLAKSIYEQCGDDIEVAEACGRVYNDWQLEYCGEAPDRLWGQAFIGLWNIDHAIAELERARKEGLKGATVWIIPPPGLSFTGDHYDRFWAAAQDLEMPVSMHINTGFGFYFEREAEDRVATITRQSVGHKVVAMNAMTEMILSGVFERFPRLKMVLAEYEIGWIPFWLEDLDRKFDRREERHTPLAPSEYFNRQVYATFTQDGVGGYLLERWGADNFMWSNDYPHPGGIWPHSDDTIALTLGGLTPEARAKVVGQTVAKLYGMPIPEPMPRQPVVNPEPIETVWHRPWVKKRGEYTFDKPTMGL